MGEIVEWIQAGFLLGIIIWLVRLGRVIEALITDRIGERRAIYVWSLKEGDSSG